MAHRLRTDLQLHFTKSLFVYARVLCFCRLYDDEYRLLSLSCQLSAGSRIVSAPSSTNIDPLETRQAPLKSYGQQLSNGAVLVSNGSIFVQLRPKTVQNGALT